MRLETYHQLGFRYKWNLQSLEDDSTGEGVIIAPRFMNPDTVERLDDSIKQSAIFDPQFFLPRVPLGQLAAYDFFPQLVSGGFATSEYTPAIALESAKRCVEFQTRNNFRYVTVPTRHIPGMPSSFIENQQSLFIDPFMKAIEEKAINKEVLIQLILNENMIKDPEYSADILNWLTSLSNVRGVYLITEVAPRTKQHRDIDFLFSLLNFVDALAENELDVVLGYLNTESLLLSLASPRIVTIGIYENTRMFNVGNFAEKENTKMQGPNARLYCSRLLQWVDHRYIGAIQRALPEGSDFFDQNKYQALMFEPTFQWHFTKPQLYKHHFLVLGGQLRAIADLEDGERYKAVVEIFEDALESYSLLESEIVFDADSSGVHLPAWLTAAHQFAKRKGWMG